MWTRTSPFRLASRVLMPKRGSRTNLPKRLVLVRHGESVANFDRTEYCRTPDWKIALTAQGHGQAVEAGKRLREIVGQDPVYFYVSPYRRTKETLAGIYNSFDINSAQVVGEREDPRLREQDVGNLQDEDSMQKIWGERDRFGRFFYRFPNGENGADVCDRVSSFLDSLFRERESEELPQDTNVVIVAHGLFMRLFVMRWFHLPVEIFHKTTNPTNCGMIVLERSPEDPSKFTITPESREMIHVPADVVLAYASYVTV